MRGAPSETVTLTPASRAEQPILARLLALYLHDLSVFFPIAPDPDGRFVYPRLSAYWEEPEARFPFMVRAGSELAGFALATRGSPASADPGVYDVAEFFVLRGLRRTGVGRRAAELLWSRLPGRWVVRVLERNEPALPFWRAAIAEHTGGAFREETRSLGGRPWRVFEFER
jgi:predicted acetyltransferase